jgi:ribosome recycling factor
VKARSRHDHTLAEENRNAIRLGRREANERIKKLVKDKLITEDDERKAIDETQKLTDQHIKQIDELQQKKDQDLLSR